MKPLIVTPKINNENFLEILIENTTSKNFDSFKLCFSLVYSIKFIKGAKIYKQTGRYYELKLNYPKLLPSKSVVIIITLQTPQIGSYNMSCGPEGTFIIDKDDKIIESFVNSLTFENEIFMPIYQRIIGTTSMPIIPEPKVIKFSDKFISCKNNFFINNEKLYEIINVLQITCKYLEIDFKSQNGIKINYRNEKLGIDEYRIDISSEQILILASDYGGRFYALISLIHLIFFYNEKLPIGVIQDKPQFVWRGMHLDCARQFHSVKQIKRLLTYMGLFKLNRFHWHLTDNEAWRLEVKSFPNLAKQTSYRGYHEFVPPVCGSGYYRYGGYYSFQDVAEIVQYAKKLNIEVMPEIDLPAHSWSTIQVMPELIDKTSSQTFHDVGNYENNTINPSLDYVWKFIEKIFADVAENFPFSIIHIGVDEIPEKAWEGSSKMKDFMNKNNINKFSEVQDYFVNRLINILKNVNKRTASWNEAVVKNYSNIDSANEISDINKRCLVFAWEDTSAAEDVLKKGFETVMSQGQTCYFDMAYNNSTHERGLCWAATIETKDIHAWQPLKNIAKNYYHLVKGIQGQLWSETLINEKYFDNMINPRLATLAEVAWSSKKRRNWRKFRPTLFQAMKITKKLGWNNHEF